MENASKALMMAVSILLAILLLSFMVYIFVFMSNYSGKVQDNLYAKEIYEFNVQFEQYDGKTNLTAQDIKSIINLVKNYNAKLENGDNDVRAIKLTVPSNLKIDNILENDLQNKQLYKCTIQYNEDRKVSQIKITL